jgi:molecular chaperone DnaJ
VLSDPRKRSAYDTRGFAGVSGFSEDELFRHVDFSDIFSGLNFDFGDLGFGVGGGGIFDRFFGRRRSGPPRGENLEVLLSVPLERIASGGEEKVRYSRRTACEECRGTGAKGGTKLHRCAACQGTGRKAQESRRREKGGEVIVRNVTRCPECGGRGEIIEEPCKGCGRTGLVERSESLTVNVPVGAEDGMALRVPGHGLPSEAPDGTPGDLFVIVRSEPDPRFERDGANLWRRETISVPEAVLGTKRTVPSLDGSVEVSIPAAAQPGLVLRLGDKGLPHFGSRGRGDFYLRLEVQIPERLSKRQRELYEQLRALEKRGGR